MSNQLKKNSSWTIIERDTFNISNIKKEILLYDTEWFLDTGRQDNAYTHKNTECYPILQSSYDWEPGDEIIIKKRYDLKNTVAQQELNNIYKQLEYFYDGKIMRVEFIKMMSNTSIRKHVDGGSFLNFARRCHIPIITNEEILFTVKDNTINMKEGVCYEINNVLPHSVSNPTNLNRVHLIIDILPNSMVK